MEKQGQKFNIAQLARTALERLSMKKSHPVANAHNTNEQPAFALNDPTRVLFPDNADNPDQSASLPLSMQLELSAQNIIKHSEDLWDRTNSLAEQIGARAQGEVTLATQSLRMVIGGVWLLTAAWLYLSASGALSGGFSAISFGVPATDAAILARTFLPIGLAGVGVAITVAAIVAATGNSANDKVRREADELGVFIADTALEFDNDLTNMRERMNRRGNPADAVVDLSHAHLTALEATAYFRQISFLTGSEGEDAKLRFRHFLTRPSGQGASRFETFMLGLLLGAGAATFIFAPRPEITAAAPPDIAKYPWAANLLLYGGLFYALAGVLLSTMSGVISAGAVSKARDEALDALRGAFTAREAPRPADVIRRIEDAVDVFRARVGGRGQSRALAGTGERQTNQDDAAPVPDWRRRDSSAQFVETGFQAAPETWRADAYAKKFARSDKQETGSKRRLLGLKKDLGD